jgi:[protein-PII] uridylyltransferase
LRRHEGGDVTQSLGAALPQAGRSAQSSSLKGYLESHRQALLDMLAQPEQAGVPFARRHAAIMDGLLQTLFAGALAGSDREPSHSPLLLAAVGGYGRQRLGWKSDLDVRLITLEEPEAIKNFAEAILYPLWDAGVSIGHQVVSIASLVADATHDLPTATALLDFRPLAGDTSLADTLEERAFTRVFAGKELTRFIDALQTESSARLKRLGDSIYLLEPDVKNGAGGLRDLDTALWAVRARYRVQDFSDLVTLGVLVPREVEDLDRAADFLWAIRNRLHKAARRRSDRLTFAEQETIAVAMGYRARIDAVPGASDAQLAGAMTEAFMSDYYRHARIVTRAREHLLERCAAKLGRGRPLVRDLGRGLCESEGLIGFSEARQLARDPALALRIYATCLARELPAHADARDAILRVCADPEFCAALRASPEAAATFVALVSSARPSRLRNDSILSELHDVGLLLAMIPEFAPVVGRVHHDVYHVYTVDVHSVAAVDDLRALVRGDLAKTRPLATRLARELRRPAMLFLATLLHDVGKAIGAKDHSRRGAEMARTILTRLGLRAEDVETACRLIAQHLAMYHVAVSRDVGDPATVAEFARAVRDRDGLRDLYLLTVTDLSTTGPTAMTQWKSSMLEELFQATDALLSDGPIAHPSRLLRVREQVKERCAAGVDRELLHEYLETMPERYLLSNTPAEIAAHAGVALGVRGTGVGAALVPSRHPDVAELCVVTETRASDAGLYVVAGDRPGLLAAISAAIASNRLDIHAAQIHSRTLADGGVQVVDLFWIRDPVAGALGVEEILPKLERDLRDVIAGSVTPDDLLKRRTVSRWSERPSPQVMTEIDIDRDGSPEHSVIEVTTKDRPGLLFTLAQTLHLLGLTIALAKINTEGSRVADVFYVTETDGQKIASPMRSELVREALFAALGPGSARPQPAAHASP